MPAAPDPTPGPAPAELPGLHVSVDAVQMMQDYDTPADRPYAFRYDLSIHNESDISAVIRGRKWVVTDHYGKKTVVEGDGVVGQTPVLEPGESFSYYSYHLVAATSTAEGAYFGVTPDGARVFTRIPPFCMEVRRQ